MAVLVAAVLVVAGGFYFVTQQAQAGVPAPAALLVFKDKVQVGHNDSGYGDATGGEKLDAGASVKTDGTGRAAIQFADGSLLRIATDTRVTLTQSQLNADGSLKQATVTDIAGRVYSSVQHLSSGGGFSVQGHSVSAEVRGTKFEVFVNSDGSNVIKVFDGTVSVRGSNTVSVNAGQQVSVGSGGNVGNPQNIQPDPRDPFQVETQSESQASTSQSGAKNNPGTAQTTGSTLSQNGTADETYNSPGGNVTAVLSYPGSLMGLSVVDPNGQAHDAQGPPPIKITIAGPPGVYKATVKGLDLPGPEPYSLTFESDAACSVEPVDTGGVVRETLSNDQLAKSMSDSGVSGISIRVEGTSSTSARLTYSSNLGGVPVSWTIDFYAATPNLGAVITQVLVNHINLTSQVNQAIKQSTDSSISSIPSDFTIDRVYSCNGSEGDMMVIEGHR